MIGPKTNSQSRDVLDSEASEAMRRWMRMPDAALGAIASPAAQNSLIVGLLLLMIAILPSQATLPPEEWRRKPT